jgi:hypothetical protein
MVFNHHGDLVKDHMCGDYHGGDGLHMIEVVERELLQAPAIYLGREPFASVSKLAAQVASGKNTAGAVKTAEQRLAAEKEAATKKELTRLLDGVVRYRDRKMKRVEASLASRPGRVIPALKALQKQLKGTELGTSVEERLKALEGSADLKAAVALEKKLEKARKTLGRLPPCRECKKRKRKAADPACAACRAALGPIFAKLAKPLRQAVEANPDLPFVKTVRAFLARLGK